jgi:hypothetical protein
MFRNFMTLAAIAGLVAGASAQQTLPTEKVTNLSYGSYDFQNGFAKTAGSNRAAGPDVLFDTMGCTAYYYGIIGLPFFKHEWLDEAQLADRGVSGVEEVNGMSWAYCNTETLGYFDAIINLYNDTVAGNGPSIWVDGQPIFADCLYLVQGLPDNGCWNITLDLSCGFECILPQASNPLSGAQGTIGWSVTPYTQAVFHGPIMVSQACNQPGSQDLFEWRDWTGAFTGAAYYHAGTFWFGGAPKIRADFQVSFSGSPEDTEGVYGSGSNGLDVLCLQALTNATPGSALSLSVDGADAAPKSYVLLISTGTPAGATTTNSNGSWTRMINVGAALKLTKVFAATGPTFGVSQNIPANAPAGAAAVVQVVRMNGSPSVAHVDQASNGLAVRL